MKVETSKKDSGFYIFPISLSANERKKFSVKNSTRELITPELDIRGKGMSIL